MSSFGYNGDISNSPLSDQSGFSDNSDDGTSSQLNHFVHGQHSFNTASQLQFYLGRMAAPGSRVNITHVAHTPCRGYNRAAINHHPNLTPSMMSQSSSQTVALSSSPVFTPAPPAPPPSPSFAFSSGGNGLTRSQPANGLIPAAVAPVVAGPARLNFRVNPPPPGYERKYMLVMCQLHDREGTPEQIADSDRLMNPFGRAGSGPSSSQGYCSICQRVVRVDSRGHPLSL